MIDVNLPMYDNARGSMTPHVLAAMAAGATSRPHDSDPLQIVLAFPNDAQAEAFRKVVFPDTPAKKR